MLTVPCTECGTILRRFNSHLKAYKHGPFCNLKCIGLFRSKHLVADQAANYKTGSRKSRSYIEVEAKWNPGANKRGYMALHRIIAEARLGRFLSDAEVVHHVDDNPNNNHWDNLKVCTQSEHAKEHGLQRKRGINGQYL